MSSQSPFSGFVAQLREFIRQNSSFDAADSSASAETAFEALALKLFALQFAHNGPYRRFCQARKLTPETIRHWRDIPAMPTSAFKELDLTSLPASQRTHVFHSSGTTGQKPSRHFHSAESLALYEASLLPWFRAHLIDACVGSEALAGEDKAAATDSSPSPREERAGTTNREAIVSCGATDSWRAWEATGPGRGVTFSHFPQVFLFLTPPPAAAPHSSLVHMFETIRRAFGHPPSAFTGLVSNDGAWTLDLDKTIAVLNDAVSANTSVILLGTAFNFVHLLDHFHEAGLRLRLPGGSRVMETGGYKGRSRFLPGHELHTLITGHLGIPATHIIREYGMSELSSQAYCRPLGADSGGVRPSPGAASSDTPDATKPLAAQPNAPASVPLSSMRMEERAGERRNPLISPSIDFPPPRVFRFPPWSRAQIISPETGREAALGETGLIRILDLANVWSVMAIQTGDLGVRRGDGFELLGRAAATEPRGCSLMSV